MSTEEIRTVETIVNDRIRENILLAEKRNVPLEEAKNMGAMALFGEKYGDKVRVITFDEDFSVELCGGTHVSASGHIGFFKILSEGSIAAGIRRIEAVTGQRAIDYVNAQIDLTQKIKTLLKNTKDLEKSVEGLLDQKQELEREIEDLHREQSQKVKQNLRDLVEPNKHINCIIQRVKLPTADSLKQVSFELRNEVDNAFIVLAADIDGKPQIAVAIADSLLKESKLNAGNIVKELAQEIKGGGGGQPFFATAGGKDIDGLDGVIQKARNIL